MSAKVYFTEAVVGVVRVGALVLDEDRSARGVGSSVSPAAVRFLLLARPSSFLSLRIDTEIATTIN